MARRTYHKVGHISSKDKESLTGNLALLLKAGVSVGEALASLQETTKTRRLQKALSQLRDQVDNGLPLWRAVDQAGLLPGQTVALIRLGEESGHLVENLQVAARQEERQRKLRARLQSAIIYPAFVLTTTLVVGLGVAWFLLPRLADTFNRLDVKLPLISRFMLGIGTFLKNHGIVAVPLALGTIFGGMLVLFALPRTRNIGRGLLLKLPGIGRLLKEVELARFGYLLGTLLEAGLSISQSFELLQTATPMLAYRKLYQHLGRSIQEGYSFNTALQAYKPLHRIMPATVRQMIVTGERSGSLVDSLHSIAEIYDEKATTTTQNLESILEPVLLLVVWVGVLLVAVSVILPIYSLLGGLQGGG